MKLAIIALFMSASAAHAGAQLGFSEIREACKDPAKFQNQIAPRNLQVSCEDRSTKWTPVASSTVELTRSREITSSLSSDKYDVAPTVQFLPVDNQLAACPRFKEVREVITFKKATTCDELLEFEGTETDFCEDILDRVRESNPKSIETTETGNTVDLCTQKPAPAPERGQRGQRGQRDQNDRAQK